MGKSEEQKLIDFLNWYNPDGAYNEIIVHEYLKGSHSPTEPTISDVNDSANDDSSLIEFQHLEFDTLQEGDFFIGTEEQYRNVFRMEKVRGYDEKSELWAANSFGHGFLCFDGTILCWIKELKKTQLTPEEFLRRAENTFKTR